MAHAMVAAASLGQAPLQGLAGKASLNLEKHGVSEPLAFSNGVAARRPSRNRSSRRSENHRCWASDPQGCSILARRQVGRNAGATRTIERLRSSPKKPANIIFENPEPRGVTGTSRSSALGSSTQETGSPNQLNR
jgi:hypothetical protein